MNATPSSPKASYGLRTADSSCADSPNPQPHNALDELSRQPLRARASGAAERGARDGIRRSVPAPPERAKQGGACLRVGHGGIVRASPVALKNSSTVPG